MCDGRPGGPARRTIFGAPSIRSPAKVLPWHSPRAIAGASKAAMISQRKTYIRRMACSVATGVVVLVLPTVDSHRRKQYIFRKNNLAWYDCADRPGRARSIHIVMTIGLAKALQSRARSRPSMIDTKIRSYGGGEL